MAAERERKYRIDAGGAAALRIQLQSAGLSGRTERQRNLVFDGVPDAVLLRLRIIEGSGRRQELTTKQRVCFPVAQDKLREELTVLIDDGPIIPLLRSLGHHLIAEYEKTTEIYELAGTLVSLDDVPGAGWFCEIEAEDAAVDLSKVAEQLGLAPSQLEPRSYATLSAGQGAR